MTEQQEQPQGWQQPTGWQQPQAQKKGGCLKFGVVGLAVIGALAVGLLVLIVVALGSISSDDDTDTEAGPRSVSGNTDNPPEADVAISECAPNEQGWMTAKGTITNHSSKASDYTVTVVFESTDGTQQFETGLASAQGLEPGQERPFDAGTVSEPPGEFTCRVAEVNRFASN